MWYYLILSCHHTLKDGVSITYTSLMPSCLDPWACWRLKYHRLLCFLLVMSSICELNVLRLLLSIKCFKLYGVLGFHSWVRPLRHYFLKSAFVYKEDWIRYLSHVVGASSSLWRVNALLLLSMLLRFTKVNFWSLLHAIRTYCGE